MAKLVAWQAPAVAGGPIAPTIVFRVLVGTDGAVKQAEVMQHREGISDVENQALEAVRGFRFEPALRGGKPVESWVILNLPLQASVTRDVQIVVKGSDTLGASLMPLWAEALQRKRPTLSVHIETLGSSTGFAGLLEGSADLAESSRLINQQELAFARKLGVQLHEVFVGYDGIAVVVHPDNPLNELDTATLAKIFSGQVTNWREVGGADVPIRAIGRPASSGTHALFKEKVLSKTAADLGFGHAVRSVESSEDLVKAVANDVAAIAYVGLAHAAKASTKTLALRASQEGKAVKPEAMSIYDGSYPITRPLVLYLRTDSARAPRALVDFALSPEGQAIVQRTGFMPMPAGSVSSFLAQPPAPQVAAPEVIRIYFDSSSTAVASDSQLDLTQASMAARAGKRILLIGNTDSVGTPEVNRQLARQRAEVVATRLRQYAGRGAQIEVEVAGVEHPLASNATTDGRRANRRVDVIVLGPGAAAPMVPAAPAAPTSQPASSGDVAAVGGAPRCQGCAH
jgi:phosphate binding protein